jgi:hypothetical protein
VDNIEKGSTLWGYYEKGVNYQAAMELTENIPLQVDFYEGRQWNKPQKGEEDMPRPVTNFIKTIVRNKKSGILSSKIKLEFLSDENPEKAGEFSQFNSTWEKEAGMDELRSRLVQEGVVKGSGFLHYYWDSEAKGKRSKHKGCLRCEVVEPLSIFFSNPQETDEQKQDWILLASRVTVKAAKAMCDNKESMDLVAADEQDAKYHEIEPEGSEMCTVLTRYFKVKGEVFYERATKATMLHKPIALTPYTDKVVLGDEDTANTELPDKPEDETDERYKAYLFPIVAYNYDTREKCIYGLSEVAQLVPNQITVNFNFGMLSFATGMSSWSPTIVKKDALNGQVITNKPGQVIADHHAGTGQGIWKLQEPPLTQMPLELNDSIISTTRFVTGTTEVMTGEQIGSNQSGASIAQLQSQALKPIEELRDRYWRACERGGKIVEMFYKLYYAAEIGKMYTSKQKDAQGKPISLVFDGTSYQSMDFDINVEAGVGTQFSEAMTIAFLEMALSTGQIDFPTFLKYYPQNALPFKATMQKEVDAGHANIVAQMQKALEQNTLQMQQMSTQIQQQQKTVDKVDSIINENRKLQMFLTELQNEYTMKIKEANAVMEQARARVGELTQDATLFADELDRRNKNVVSKVPNSIKSA